MHRYKKKTFYFGIAIIAVLAVLALVGVFYTPYEADGVNYKLRMAAPSLKHLFGTDNMGRDVFSRVMVGLGTTFLVSFGIVAIGAGTGILVGAFTGYFGGAVDEIIMRINDSVASFPSILLALVCVSLFGANESNVVIVLGILFIPSFARVVRSEYIREKEKDYVKNAVINGASRLRIMFYYILPNIRESCFSTIAIGINNAILAEAGLSYLGLGVQPPTPSLGRMLAEGQSFITKAPWICIFPGLIIVLAVLGFSFIGEAFENSSIVPVEAVGRRRIKAFLNKEKEAKFSGNNEEKQNEEKVLLKAENLHIAVSSVDGLKEVVKGLSFTMKEGECLGIVGESGSGKSMSASAIMGILKGRAVFRADSLSFNGEELTKLDEKQLNRIRGNSLTMVFQEPMTSLNPSKKIGKQIEQVIRNHNTEHRIPSEELKTAVFEAMEKAGLDEMERIYSAYPHELSGGQRQRVLIAMAVVMNPKLIICDEPTTALDAEVADKILEQLKKLQNEYKMAILFISHDISVVEKLCERVMVLKDGEKVEEGSCVQVMNSPEHPYTKELVLAGQWSESIKHKEPIDAVNSDIAEEICRVEGLNVHYRKHRKESLQVINNLHLSVNKGECVGISGKSGSGKTTLLKALTGMISYEGKITVPVNTAMVFQDPYSSLNPSMSVGKQLDEVQKLYYRKNKKREASEQSTFSVPGQSGEKADCRMPDKTTRKAAAVKVLEQVGLGEEYLSRRPGELSGGQRQRVAIAMAVINRPELVLLDEPVTALDVSIQSKVLELLLKLKEEYHLTYILISHDEKLLSAMCDRVLKLG
ncbi:MAG: ATP-binding cassette domain-containing protein [Lachnospiraceae bacterium]